MTKAWSDPDALAREVKARGDWSNTANGNVVFPLDPRPEDVVLDDIAQALGRICRFNGCLRRDVEHYCVTPATPVLTDDLQWLSAGDLRIGDGLLAFDENPVNRGTVSRGRRKTQHAIVEHAEPIERDLVRLVLANGDELVASAEHPWLVCRPSSQNQLWETAANIAMAVNMGRRRHIKKYLPTWQTLTTNDAGWLSGFMDGEGSVCFHQGGVTMAYGQLPGLAADKAMSICASLGLQMGSVDNKKSGVQNHSFLGGWSERLRALGSLRPVRLLDKFTSKVRAGQLRIEYPATELVEIVAAEHIGRGEVVALQTSSRTYFANGYCAHNSVAQHSVIVSHTCPPKLALVGLLHDAHEAYLGDVTTPVKQVLSGSSFRATERWWQWAIAEAFGVDDQLLMNMPREVKSADLAALATERRDLVNHRNRPWGRLPDPLPEHIVPLRAFDAIDLFIARFDELMNGRDARRFTP